jgi:tRNA1Val (adenine37-N6)-methyltransferase
MEQRFRFKQFQVRQDRAAMKVGTDGVLLGAWADIGASPGNILDIGAGTGLIALMLAQRCPAAVVDAIELDADAFEQCVENFEDSPWPDRLFCYHASLQAYALEIAEEYDLIVSNPPFYTGAASPGNTPREMARHSISLPPSELLSGVSRMLAITGTFCTIVPYSEEQSLIKKAAMYALYPHRITRVRGNPRAHVKRSLLALKQSPGKALVDEIAIEHGRHEYSADYVRLTSDFYLRM